MISPHGDFGLLAAIDEVPEEESSTEDRDPPRKDSYLSINDDFTPGVPQNPAQIFSRFISYLGPSMVLKSFSDSE